MANQGNPELRRLLATLHTYGQQNPAASSGGYTTTAAPNHTFHIAKATSEPQPTVIPGLGLLQQEQKPPVSEPVSTAKRKSDVAPQLQNSGLYADGSSRSTTPSVPDASTITTWPAALKHLTKHLVNNEKASERIRHLISEQHKHEQQWWSGREALLARQEGRSGTSQQVFALLKSLGGKEVPVTTTDAKANQAELEAYDKKVYAGLVSMAADFDRQLRTLGVPFYAIKHDLVILENGREKESAVKGRIDKGELRELQRRMLQTLEDLFAD